MDGAVAPADAWPPLQSGIGAEVHRALRHARQIERDARAERPDRADRRPSPASIVCASPAPADSRARSAARPRGDTSRARCSPPHEDWRAGSRSRRSPARLRRNTTPAPRRPSPSRCARHSPSHPTASCARRRSASASVDVTRVENAVSSRPATSSARIVMRDIGGSVRVSIDRRAVLLEERDRHGRGRGVRIREQDVGVEERPGRALRQIIGVPVASPTA